MNKAEKYFRYFIPTTLFGTHRTKEILNSNPITNISRKDAEHVFVTVYDYDESSLDECKLHSVEQSFAYKANKHITWINIDDLLGTRHGVGNCIVMNHIEEYYPEGVAEFKRMVEKNNIDIPQGICKGLTDDQFDTMINVSLGMKPLWENALGKDWEKIMTREKLRNLYEKL